MVFEIPPGHDGWVIGDEPFVAYDVAGVRSFARVDEKTQRVLGTVLFTDIVEFDRAWRSRSVRRAGASSWGCTTRASSSSSTASAAG